MTLYLYFSCHQLPQARVMGLHHQASLSSDCPEPHPHSLRSRRWLPSSSSEALIILSYLVTLLLSANPIERLSERHEFLGRSGDFSAQHWRTAPHSAPCRCADSTVGARGGFQRGATSLFSLRSPSIEEEPSVRQEGQADRSDSVRIWVLFGFLGFMSVCEIQERVRWWGEFAHTPASICFPSVFKCFKYCF